jgi:hypothetical protein
MLNFDRNTAGESVVLAHFKAVSGNVVSMVTTM